MSTPAPTAASARGSGNGYAVGVEVNGVRYPSARAADIALGLPFNTVQHRAHAKCWPTYKWLGATPGPRRVRNPEDCLVGKLLVEPERWAFDGGARRAPVLDPNFNPPRVVRTVGWRQRCMTCGRPHWSDDVARIRMCCFCGGAGGTPIGADPDEDA